MNLQQLRYLAEVAGRDLNLSRAADALHTSQPGISRQIRLLEEELGTELLVRQGNRIAALTQPGVEAVEIARRALREIENLRTLGEDASRGGQGRLVIATTHAHARYILIPIVRAYQAAWPDVSLGIRQGHPDQIVDWVQDGEADIGLCTDPTRPMPELARLPCYKLARCVLVPDGHALQNKRRPSLAELARFPMITLDQAFASGVTVLSAFARAGLSPKVVLSATDADVIKAFVAAGVGIATLPEIAFDVKRDKGLARIGARHLFEPSVSSVWLHRHHYQRRLAASFVQMLSPAWTPERVQQALRSKQAPGDSTAVDLTA
jgi:LysR family cys regulon transcriptional activator